MDNKKIMNNNICKKIMSSTIKKSHYLEFIE